MTVDELKSAYKHKQPFSYEDPVFARTPLQHRATFFPLGFPTEILTNAPEVLDCAATSWLGYTKLFNRAPIQVRVIVQEDDGSDCPPAPSTRAQGHLLINVADARNYSIIDFVQQFAFISLTPAALRHHTYFRYFFLESSVLTQISMLHATGIHAACVELDGKGVLLCGDSGAGKSTLSYACAQDGWTYISDDGSFLVHNRSDRLVIGNFRQMRFRPSATELFPELKGREVIHRAEAGKPSIELFTAEDRQIRRALTSKVHHIVFLHRRGVRHPGLVPFPRDVARHYILQTAACLPELHSNQGAQIDNFLRIQPYELQYHDLSWATSRLRQLVGEGGA